MSDKLVRSSIPAPPAPPAPGGGGAYDPGLAEEGEGSGLDLRELLSVLRRQWWIVALLGAAGLAGTYYLLSQEQRQYRSNALLRLRDAQAEVAGGVLQQGGAPATRAAAGGDALMSELMVLRGRQVAGAVVDREGLRLYDQEQMGPASFAGDILVTLPPAEMTQVALTFSATGVTATTGSARVTAAYGEPLVLEGVRFMVPLPPADRPDAMLVVLPRESAIDWMIGVLGARQTEGTDAITVSVTAASPVLATRITNAVVEEYQRANMARAREINRRRRTFLEDRLRETDDSLVAAQLALGRFRSRTGVYSSRDQNELERAGASEAEAQRKRLEADQRVRRGYLVELGRSETPTRTSAFRSLMASSEVAANPLVSQLFARFSELETRRDEVLATGRPRTHDEVRQIENLLEATESRLVEAIRTQVGVLDAQVAALGSVRQQAAAEINRLAPAEAEEVRFGEQVEAMRAVGNQLRAELQRVRLAEAVEMGQVEIVDPATRAAALPSRNLMKLGLGLAFGLFLGAAIAFIREQLDTSIHRRTDVERSLRIPGLAIIPQLQASSRRRLFGRARRAPVTFALPGGARRGGAPAAPTVLPELVTVANVRDSAAEAYRSLRTRLLFANSGSALRSVVVTSASAGEGKTTTTANLAVTLAQQGMRVLLVDGDLRRPRLHAMFGVGNEAGLADYLIGRASAADVIRLTGVERLSLLTSGSAEGAHAGPSELLGSAEMGILLAGAADRFDIVLIDSPPVLAAPDASVLAARAGSTLLVVRAGNTGRALAQDAMQQLAAVGANVVGAVLNDPDARTARYREYAYQYGYYAAT